jgi:hypothetical protein
LLVERPKQLPRIRDRFLAAFLSNAVLRNANPPKLQFWAALAHVPAHDPIFVVHKLKVERLKLPITHNGLHRRNNFVLLGSIFNFIHRNLWPLSQEHLRARAYIDWGRLGHKAEF